MSERQIAFEVSEELFLSLTTEAFEVLRLGEFLQRWRTGML